MGNFLEEEKYDLYNDNEKDPRYDDFFVIPNEQYDHSRDDEKFNKSFDRPEQYLHNDLNKIS